MMQYAASMKNPPKGYGSIETGMKVVAYCNQRLDFWRKQLKAKGYTDECLTLAEKDVIATYGKPF